MPRKPTVRLDEVLNKIGAKVDVSALAHSLVEEFGGPTGLGKFIAKAIQNTDSPSVQAQLLRATISLVEAADAKSNVSDEISQLTDEDLEAVIRQIELPE